MGNTEMSRNLISNFYLPQSSSSSEEPEMGEVMNTLRILSHHSVSRMKPGVRVVGQESHAKCPNCNGAVLVKQRPRSRDDILRHLGQLETTLQARGEQLPPWVQAYKGGDSVKAAKLLHLSYVANRKNISGMKRGIGQEVTSTTGQDNDVRNLLGNDDQDNASLTKRIRLVS